MIAAHLLTEWNRRFVKGCRDRTGLMTCLGAALFASLPLSAAAGTSLENARLRLMASENGTLSLTDKDVTPVDTQLQRPTPTVVRSTTPEGA